MDDTHVEFVELVNRTEKAGDASFVHLFDSLVEQVHAHFEYERQFMLESRFPALIEHCDEHDRVLGDLHEFSLRVHKGLIAFGRNYIRDSMALWFPLHSATMDSALAAYLRSLPAWPARAAGIGNNTLTR